MATWFTSDLHLGHANIIRYCDRPFASVPEMDRALVDRWNQVVAPDDVVWVLGDVALGPIAESLPLVGDLAGHVILVSGNHDRCWPGHGRRAEGWTRRYLDAGFAEVHHGVVATEVAGTPVRLCHFPPEGDSHDEDRFDAFRPVDDGGWLLHGHVHTRWAQRGRMVNVGVDTAGYRPVAEATIAALVAAGPADRASLVGVEPTVRSADGR